MRILHVITTMDLGGAEKHVAALASAQVAAGQDVRILYLSGDGPAVPAGISASRMRPRRPHALSETQKWLQGHGIVHAHLPRGEITGATLASRRAPLIISRHNTEPFIGTKPSSISRRASRLLTGRADTVIAISESVKRYHLSTGHLTRDTRVAVIPYGYQPIQDSTVNSYEWGERQDGVVRIACVARLAPQKDLGTLLRGVARLRSLGRDVDLRIAGEGPDRSALMALRDSLGLRENVTLLGKIPNPESFIAGADVFALTSKYEGLGLVLLEAMAAGTPIVAARNTAIEEVVTDGEAGLLFETGDHADFAAKVLRFTSSNQLVADTVKAAHQRLTTSFSVDTMRTQTDEVYCQALGRAI